MFDSYQNLNTKLPIESQSKKLTFKNYDQVENSAASKLKLPKRYSQSKMTFSA